MTDVRTETLELLRVIELEHHYRGWVPDGQHEPPIYSIYRDGDGLDRMQMPVPPAIWRSTARVGQALRTLAAVLGALPPVPGIVGIAIMTEAFMVTEDPRNLRKSEEYRQASRERRIHAHPDRREIRIVQAIVDGERAAVSRIRGGPVRQHPDEEYWTGDVAESLRILYDQMVRDDRR